MKPVTELQMGLSYIGIPIPQLGAMYTHAAVCMSCVNKLSTCREHKSMRNVMDSMYKYDAEMTETVASANIIYHIDNKVDRVYQTYDGIYTAKLVPYLTTVHRNTHIVNMFTWYKITDNTTDKQVLEIYKMLQDIDNL